MKIFSKHIAITIGVLGFFIAVISTAGWIRYGHIAFPIVQLVGISAILEVFLFAQGVRAKLKNPKEHAWHLIALVLLGAGTGVFIFDVVGIQIFKLWEYPIYSPTTNPVGYLSVAWAWGLYFLIFHQSYELLHGVLHREHRHTIEKGRCANFLRAVGPAGVVLLLIGVAFPALADSPPLSALIAAIGAWFILEGFELPRKRPTLLLDVLNGNFRPFTAMLIGSVVIGFLSEFANAISPVRQWVYYGVPWASISVLGVPVSLLLSWMVMYIIFLSLENIVIRTKGNIWD